MEKIDEELLKEVSAELKEIREGAYNIRKNRSRN